MRRLGLTLIAAAALVAASGAARADDKQEGEKVFKKYCMACHTVEPGKNKIGPSLAGAAGRKAGQAQDFTYSDAMKKAEVTWTEENLDKYLADPKAFIPGNKMAFAGVKKPEERHAVIEYLESVKQTASTPQEGGGSGASKQ